MKHSVRVNFFLIVISFLQLLRKPIKKLESKAILYFFSENSNLCDILMLERQLENEVAKVNEDNKVDMLEIPGKGRCFVYLAR